MKRILFTGLLITTISVCQAQVKLGLKLSPNLSWNRVVVPEDVLKGDGIKLRFGAGVFLDFEFSDNYALSTGITYTTKGFGLQYDIVDTTGKKLTKESKYSLQYLEIPVSLKLFTNEIGTDMRLYFQVGTTLNTNLAAKVDGEKSYKDSDGETVDYAKSINFFDISALAAAGVEMQMGENTWFFGGLSYNRGLLNINNKKYGFDIDGLNIYNEYLAIDFGLKF